MTINNIFRLTIIDEHNFDVGIITVWDLNNRLIQIPHCNKSDIEIILKT